MANRFYVDNYDKLTQKERNKLRQIYDCAECGDWVNWWLENETQRVYLACHRHSFNKHEGVAKKFVPPNENLSIARREQMGNEVAIREHQALVAKGIPLTGVLTEPQAREVLIELWPEAEKASPAEFFKAMKLCTQYGLNPLMRHLFLLPFWNSEKKRYEHTCVQGISSNRLIASRKHRWSFLDDTPRIGSEEEIQKHYGKYADLESRLYCIAKIKDLDTGAEVTGWGEWPLWKSTKDGKKVPNEPKGVDKGNSILNMGCIHAERNGLDKLYPADMPPSDIPVYDEQFMDTPSGKVDTGTGELIEEEPAEVEFTEVIVGAKEPLGKISQPKKKEPTQAQKLNEAIKETGYLEDEIKAHVSEKYAVSSLKDLTLAQLKELTSDILNYQVARIPQPVSEAQEELFPEDKEEG